MKEFKNQSKALNPQPDRRASRVCIFLLVAISAFSFLSIFPMTVSADENPARPVSEIPWKERTKHQQAFEARYDELHTSRSTPGQNDYLTDNYDWVVTSQFAERYGFPREMVDDTLEGAIAVAFRIYEGISSCGVVNGGEFCMAKIECEMDYYFDNSKNKIPWLNDTQQYVFIRALGSLLSLPRRIDDVTANNHNSFTLFDDLASKEGLPFISTGGTVLFFDRKFGPNISVIGIRNCPETQKYPFLKEYRLGFFASKENFLSQRQTIVRHQFMYNAEVKYDYVVVLPPKFTELIHTKYGKLSRDITKNNKTIQSVIDKYTPKQN